MLVRAETKAVENEEAVQFLANLLYVSRESLGIGVCESKGN
jgi:hypothetical protein